MFIVSISLIITTGYLTITSLLPFANSREKCILTLPFGMGLTTLLLWGLLSLNIPLSQLSLITFQLFITMSLAYYAYRKNGIKDLQLFSIGFRKVKVNFYWLLILFLFGVGFTSNYLIPIISTDGIGYKVIGKLMVGEQLLNFHNIWFPFSSQNKTLGFHLISGYFHLFGFSNPKFIQSFFFISLIVLFHTSIRKFSDLKAANTLHCC